jgi:hypothetical protein
MWKRFQSSTELRTSVEREREQKPRLDCQSSALEKYQRTPIAGRVSACRCRSLLELRGRLARATGWLSVFVMLADAMSYVPKLDVLVVCRRVRAVTAAHTSSRFAVFKRLNGHAKCQIAGQVKSELAHDLRACRHGCALFVPGRNSNAPMSQAHRGVAAS